MKMENYKKRQHYVWKYYLKPWTTDGKIWCKKRNDSIFNPSLENIGQEKFFYESHKLNELENTLVTGIINKMHPSGHELIFSMYDGYLVTANSTDYLKRNGIEDYHGSVEQSVIAIFNDLYKKDRNFLNKNYKKMNICYFIGMQYPRTKKSQISVSSSMSKLPTPSEFLGRSPRGQVCLWLN